MHLSKTFSSPLYGRIYCFAFEILYFLKAVCELKLTSFLCNSTYSFCYTQVFKAWCVASHSCSAFLFLSAISL